MQAPGHPAFHTKTNSNRFATRLLKTLIRRIPKRSLTPVSETVTVSQALLLQPYGGSYLLASKVAIGETVTIRPTLGITTSSATSNLRTSLMPLAQYLTHALLLTSVPHFSRLGVGSALELTQGTRKDHTQTNSLKLC